MSGSRIRSVGLAADGVAHALGHGLSAIAATSAHAYARRSGRVAFTLQAYAGPGEVAPSGFIRLDSLRLIALGYRLVDDGHGGMRRRAPLAVYRPFVDLPGRGRISFRCSAAFDAAGRAGPGLIRLDVRRNRRLARAAVALHQAVDDVMSEGVATTPILPRFYWAFGPDRLPAFGRTFLTGEWAGTELAIDGLRAWPAEIFVRPIGSRAEFKTIPDQDGGDCEARAAKLSRTRVAGDTPLGGAEATIPPERWPTAIFASIDGLQGRSVRNPAYAVLRRLGLVPGEGTYRDWLASLAPRSRHEVPDRNLETEAARALGERIAAFATSGPAAQARLLAETREGCDAAGVAVPDDDEAGLQFLAGLIMSPWSRVEIPGAGAIQVIRRADDAGPARHTFADQVADLDLDDLGEHGDRGSRLDPVMIKNLLLRRPSRGAGHGRRRA